MHLSISTATCSCSGLLPPTHVAVPCLCIPDCTDGFATVDTFHAMKPASDGGGISGFPTERTSLQICHSVAGIRVEWSFVDANVVTTTADKTQCKDGVCSHCHDDVWEADAAEFYFSRSLSDNRTIVTEVDHSAARGGLWGGWVNNSNGYGPDTPNELIPCTDTVVEGPKLTAAGWAVNITVPWSAYGPHGPGGRATTGRINFYRMDHGLPPPLPSFTNSAWSPTLCDGHKKCNTNHVPKYFGVARFVAAKLKSTSQGNKAAMMMPSPPCQKVLDAYCNVPDTCLAHVKGKFAGPLTALHSSSLSGATLEWRCYATTSMNAKHSAYSQGGDYCTRDAELAALNSKPPCNGTLPPVPPPAPTPGVTNRHSVFISGQEGYHTFRIPALVVKPNSGSWFLFAEGRKLSSADHDWNDVVMKRSTDAGATWGALEILATASNATHHVTLGNPAPILTMDGEIILLFCEGNKKVWTMRSSAGVTKWSAPKDISAMAMPGGAAGSAGAEWSFVATGPPGGLEIILKTNASKRLIVGTDHMVAKSGAWGSHSLISDDGGVTWWTSPAVSGLAQGGGNECQIAPLANGSLILSMRTKNGIRQWSTSEDSGATWSAPVVTRKGDPLSIKYDGGTCEGSTVAVGQQLAFSTPYSTTARANVSVFLSKDNGASWTSRVVVDHGAAGAYSTMQPLGQSGASVALAWEVSHPHSYATIDIAEVSVASSDA